ncbi:P-loop containing nucleoside triphosphate hydrolase protein [Xylaria palmicola]|nr:P-loop containing nucleoside triphosphate hydrolase protein [Xylaria palmicola]
MGGVPSVPRDPSRRVQVICAGFSRTGTSTMALAVEKLLDGPVLHGGTQILNREDAYCKKWVQAYEAKARGNRERTANLLREVTAGFVAVADMPPLNFIPELMALYPEARVVLVERDPNRWLASVAVLADTARRPWLPYLVWVVPGWRWFPALVRHYSDWALGSMRLDPEGDMRPTAEFLIRWNNLVKEMVPPEKLLVMRLQDGWEPLCEFLDVPVPEGPLPRANDTEAMLQVSEHVARRLALIWGAVLGVMAVVAFGAWRAWNTR